MPGDLRNSEVAHIGAGRQYYERYRQKQEAEDWNSFFSLPAGIVQPESALAPLLVTPSRKV
jgi:hypothetical protein